MKAEIRMFIDGAQIGQAESEHETAEACSAWLSEAVAPIARRRPLGSLRLAIEMQPLGNPKPLGVGVFEGENTLIGYLEINQLREIVTKWDEMWAARYGTKR